MEVPGLVKLPKSLYGAFENAQSTPQWCCLSLKSLSKGWRYTKLLIPIRDEAYFLYNNILKEIQLFNNNSSTTMTGYGG